MKAKNKELSYTTSKGVFVSVVLEGCVVTISSRGINKKFEIVKSDDIATAWDRIQQISKNEKMNQQDILFEIDELVDCKPIHLA